MSALQEEGMPATVQVFTSLMDAFLKHGGADSADMVFQIFQEMQEAGVAPSAVTYGCLLLACGKQRKVDTAFELYQRACDEVCWSTTCVLVSVGANRCSLYSTFYLVPSCERLGIAICRWLSSSTVCLRAMVGKVCAAVKKAGDSMSRQDAYFWFNRHTVL